MAGDYDLQSIWEAMEDDLIASYRRNMARHTAEEARAGFSWPQWQALKIQDLKRYEDDIAGLLKKYGGQSEHAVARAMEKNFTDGISNADRLLDGLDAEVSSSADFFRANERRLGALQTAIGNDMSDAKQAVLRMSDDVFRQTIYKAQTFYSAGAATIWRAVDMASKDFLSRGLNCIEYSNGTRVNIASYAEMALRASSKKAYMVGEGRRSAEYGVTLCQITQYSACSETCRPWQGRVYIDDVYAGGQDDGKHTLLSWAIENGLFHPNCRHIKQPWYDGISEELQPIDGAEMGENYDAEQRQREIERYIRQWKRRADGSLDTKNQEAARQKVKDWQAEMRRHLEDNPQLRRDSDREQVRDGTTTNERISRSAVRIPDIKSAGKDSFSQKAEYNPNATFQVSLPQFSEEINQAISAACKNVVEDGITNHAEKAVLLNMKTGQPDYSEYGDETSVGGAEFFAHLDKIKDKANSLLFVHNHPSGMTFSLDDLNTALTNPALKGVIASGHNGKIYIALVKEHTETDMYHLTKKYDQEIVGPLRKQLKDGTITPGEFTGIRNREWLGRILKDYFDYTEVTTG